MSAIAATTWAAEEKDSSRWMLSLISPNSTHRQAAIELMTKSWEPSYTPALIDILRINRHPEVTHEIYYLLRENNNIDLYNDPTAWAIWSWNQPYKGDAGYVSLKGDLYSLVDQRFKAYFDPEREALIRWDEVVWGGVAQDGIPPLRDPRMIEASKAGYLEDDNVVFGIEVNGDARAYPKRILAWHEMFTDTVGGVAVAGVYCTLCGSVILYETEVDGTQYNLGTSGFLYRSNKLMYDRATQSLWSTLEGKPVIGPLVGQGIELPLRSVVTTTWGEWKERHPKTKVLSIRTGHKRDYGEGVAYQDYFATDRLMFYTPSHDPRLNNKAEILALRSPTAPEPTAISVEFLSERPVYQTKVGEQQLLILTDGSGANRVYGVDADHTFSSYDGEQLTDADGNNWSVSEDSIRGKQTAFRRYPAHRAFWFGWQAQFPKTELIK
ncbi:MAG: DUF3179 domain-containing protein [Verrucomicrobiota bacterium]